MPSLWSNVAAFAAVPLLVWLVAAGYGLLIERVAATRFPNALLLPLGFCAAIIIALGVYETGAGDSIAVPVVLVPAAVGLALAGRSLPARLNAGWPLIAGVAVFILFDLSVIATGHWTLTFYNVTNDSAYELVLIAHLQAHGTQAASGQASTAKSVITSYLSTGYPLGAQSLLGIVSGVLGVSAAVVWQGFIAAMAAIGAVSMSLLSGRTMKAVAAAVLAVVSMSAALTYQFALQGSIKEIGTLVGVLSALAVIRWTLVSRNPVGIIVSAVPLAAILATFNAAGIPFVAALIGSGVVGWLILERPRPSRDWIRPVLVGGIALAILAVPALLTLGTFLGVAQSGYSGPHPSAPTLGPLLRPLPLSEVSGVWLYGDYRAAVPPGVAGAITAVVTVVLFTLGAAGIVRALRLREPAPLMGTLTMGLVLLIVYPRVTPYAAAKLLMIASPIVPLCAGQALAGWRRLPLRALAATGILLITAAVFASDALAYHVAPVLPTERMLAMAQVGRWIGHRGPVLDSEFEQFAKVFTFPAPLIDGPDNPTPVALALIRPADQYGHSFDLNQMQFAFVESFPYVLTRRSPVASRPPANYRLAMQNADYQLWHRVPGLLVLFHTSAGGSGVTPNARPSCPALQAVVRTAPRGSMFAVSTLPDAFGFPIADARRRSTAWVPNNSLGGGFVATAPGRATSPIAVSHSGRYQIWIQGNLPRPMTVLLDGREVSSVQSNNTPDGWLRAGSVRVGAGHHVLSVVRAGVDLGPGGGGLNETVDAVALAPDTATPAPALVPLRNWRRLCTRPSSWVEVVRPAPRVR